VGGHHRKCEGPNFKDYSRSGTFPGADDHYLGALTDNDVAKMAEAGDDE